MNIKYVKLKIKGNRFSDHTDEVPSVISSALSRTEDCSASGLNHFNSSGILPSRQHIANAPPNRSISMNEEHCQSDAYVNVLTY